MPDNYVYRLYDSNGQLLYIGVTNNIDVRLGAHKCTKGWWPQVDYIKLKVSESRSDSLIEEARAIKEEQPAYNEHTGMFSDYISHDETLHVPKTHARLPQEEIDRLLSMDTPLVYERAAELRNAGWSVVSILEGIRIKPTTTQLRTELKYQYNPNTGIPLPEMPKTDVEVRAERKAEHIAQGMTPAEKDSLKQLADLAKKYRPSYAPSHPYAQAVRDYQALIYRLHSRGVTPTEMGKVANVHPATISRRFREARKTSFKV